MKLFCSDENGFIERVYKRGATQENQGNLYSTRPERKDMNVFCFYLTMEAESITHKKKETMSVKKGD